MGLQKFHTFNGRTYTEENGAIVVTGRTGWGEHVALIRNCPCGDIGRRTAYVTGEADTFFSIPAAVRVKGKNVRGFLTRDESGWQFHANKES